MKFFLENTISNRKRNYKPKSKKMRIYLDVMSAILVQQQTLNICL